MAPTTKLNIIFGAMTFGKEGNIQVRTSNIDDCAAIVDTFQKHGHSEIDTARFYGDGTSEGYLAQLKWQDRGLTMATKFFPNTIGYFGRPKTHLTLEHMSQALDESLSALNSDKVDLWYLHGPDRTVKLEDIARDVHELSKTGKFKKWGLSNFMSWEVAAICEICDKNGWARPSVYQGVYNALHRSVEHELITCLRRYGMAFYAFNPLAGGILTDRYHRDTSEVESGSRFDNNIMQGQMYRARYWNDANFNALDLLRAETKKEGLRESECALRWMMHHSHLKSEFGDKVIIGASSQKQLESNLKDFEGEALPENVVQALDKGWEFTRGGAWKYFH